jgi:hypothetical protein
MAEFLFKRIVDMILDIGGKLGDKIVTLCTSPKTKYDNL